MVISTDWAKTFFYKWKKWAFFLFGEMGGYTFGSSVNRADFVANLSPDIDNLLDVVLREIDFLLNHVSMRIYFDPNLLIKTSTCLRKRILILDIITLVRSKQSKQFILVVLHIRSLTWAAAWTTYCCSDRCRGNSSLERKHRYVFRRTCQ